MQRGNGEIFLLSSKPALSSLKNLYQALTSTGINWNCSYAIDLIGKLISNLHSIASGVVFFFFGIFNTIALLVATSFLFLSSFLHSFTPFTLRLKDYHCVPSLESFALVICWFA